MRFVPYTESQLQSGETSSSESDTNDVDYLSDLSNEDVKSFTIDANNDEEDDNNSATSEEELTIDSLSTVLSTYGLEDRFKLTCQLGDVVTNHTLDNFDSRYNTGNTRQSEKTSKLQKFNKDNNDRITSSKPVGSDVATFFMEQFTLQRQHRKDMLENLIKIEQERLRKEEEEARRKIEEERKRKAEEERKAKEEAERIAREAAERKAREEAERRRLEEERKRLEEEQKQKELEIAKRKKEEAEKQEREKAAKLEAEKKQKVLEIQKLQQKKIEEQNNQLIKPDQIEQEYQKYMKDVQDIESQIVEPVKANPELKKLVGAHRRKINPKFGQLTNSQQQLTRITKEIYELVQQTVNNEVAFKWILNFISDAIISQAETEVSVKPKSSIPLAKLTLNLLILYKDLKYFLLAKFYKSCCFLLGYSCSSDTEEGRIRLGWNRDEDTGKWESDIQYNERLAGISTLYSVITRLRLDNTYIGYDPSSTVHPLPISHSWIFLSRMVDVPAAELTETHYTIVGSWWDACASEFLNAYGRQSTKLLQLVAHQWTTPQQAKSNAGMVRLKLLGEEWMMNRNIKSFPPMER